MELDLDKFGCPGKSIALISPAQWLLWLTNSLGGAGWGINPHVQLSEASTLHLVPIPFLYIMAVDSGWREVFSK